MRTANFLSAAGLAALVAATACGGDDGDGAREGGGNGTAGTSAGGGEGGITSSAAASPGAGGVDIGAGASFGVAGSAGAAASGSGEACASVDAATSLRPVRLAFLLDVSGSMGKGDFDWHDRDLKWEPVIAATKSFFEDAGSSGLRASLTFFPDSSDRCEASQYDPADVAVTELPSSAFGEAIDAISPESADDWRGGTPTLAALQGTFNLLAPEQIASPDTQFAIVLITDGYPQSCDDNAISSVEALVADQADDVPTYVIGVRNPPIDGAPETVDDLDAIAVAGGTRQAYFIDTGDPEATTSSLLNVINGIRGDTVSCDLPVPPAPEGRELDPQRVGVTYTSDGTATPLVYDRDCTQANGWNYDDPENPTSIRLCDDTCATVQGDPAAELSVEFACEVLIPQLF